MYSAPRRGYRGKNRAWHGSLLGSKKSPGEIGLSNLAADFPERHPALVAERFHLLVRATLVRSPRAAAAQSIKSLLMGPVI